MSRYNSTAQVVEVQLGLVCRTVAVSMWPDNWIKLFSTFPQPSQYPQLPTVTLLPSTHKSSRSVPFLSPVGTHSYQQSHYCPPHTNQAVPCLSSVQSVPKVTNSHTAAPHTQIKPFRTFPPPSRYPQLPTVTLLPSTHKSSRSVTFLSPVGSHSYQQSHCCPPHTNQAVQCLSPTQSVPTVTNSHTAALHKKLGRPWHPANGPPACQYCTGFTPQYFNFPSSHLYQRTSGHCMADVTEP